MSSRWTTFHVGGETFGLLSFPVAAGEQAAPELTAAESEVADLIASGHSNAAIAVERATSVRTVANQIASIFGKLHVGSRAELCALLAQRRRAPGRPREDA